MSGFRVLWGEALLFIVCATAHAQPKRDEGNLIPYSLLPGSTLSLIAPGQSNATGQTLTGAFTLQRQASPLDWDVFTLIGLRLLPGPATNNPPAITGTGTYQLSERFGNTRQLRLDLQISNQFVHLESGSISNDQNWPLLDIVVTNSAATNLSGTNFTVHLVAAPIMSSWRYQLLSGSYFLDDCLVCDHAPIYEPLQGSFDLTLISENPLQNRYVIRNLNLTSSQPGNPRQFTGQGTYSVGGEVALVQSATLQLNVSFDATNLVKSFTNSDPTVTQLWPMLKIHLDETNGTPAQTYRLQMVAAPVRELWFSTGQNLTNQNGTLVAHSSDLLSAQGRTVRNGSNLLASFGVPPNVAGYGITALTIVPGGQIQFSLTTNVTSTLLGELSPGDLLSERGVVVKRNQDLTAALAIMPPVPNLGLSAIQVMDDGEILFSMPQTAFSEAFGTTVGQGDLLSSRRGLRKTNPQLLANFHPDSVNHDYGLDAFYIWPSGEIWFSTTEGFTDRQFGAIGDGDVLSDQGYVVFRNADLIRAFAPATNQTNAGLTALYVVTDATASPPPPASFSLAPDAATDNVVLQWQALGRVFAVEKTPDLFQPFSLASTLLPATNWTDAATLKTNTAAFYRLDQW